MDLSTLPFGQVGLVGTLVGTILYTVRLVVRGELVPRKFHQEILDDRDRWRVISEQLTQQNAQLINSTRLSVVAMQEIADRAATIRDEQDGVL